MRQDIESFRLVPSSRNLLPATLLHKFVPHFVFLIRRKLEDKVEDRVSGARRPAWHDYPPILARHARDTPASPLHAGSARCHAVAMQLTPCGPLAATAPAGAAGG